MSGILTSTQASGSAVTGHLCPKTDVVASKWIAIATITAVFGHTSPNEPSWRHKMLESADLARLPSDRSRKWEIPDHTAVDVRAAASAGMGDDLNGLGRILVIRESGCPDDGCRGCDSRDFHETHNSLPQARRSFAGCMFVGSSAESSGNCCLQKPNSYAHPKASSSQSRWSSDSVMLQARLRRLRWL